MNWDEIRANANYKYKQGHWELKQARKKTKKYWRLRRRVFTRDKFQCQKCKSPNFLVVHHVLSFQRHPKLRFNDTNCATLCNDCHKKIHPWLYKKDEIIPKKPIKTILRKKTLIEINKTV